MRELPREKGGSTVPVRPESQEYARTRLRTLLGFLVAPLAPSLLVGSLTWVKAGSPGWAEVYYSAWMYISVAAFFGYPVALVLGVPTQLLFRRWGWVASSAYAAAGAVFGVVLFAFFFVPPTLERASGAPPQSHACLMLRTLAPFSAYSVAASTVAASAFRIVVRPDHAGRSRRREGRPQHPS